MASLLIGLQTLNQLLTAGIAITAFSLLIYALTFNLRDRVARSFAMILACLTIVYAGDAFSSVATTPREMEFWLRWQWVGITFLPATYFYSSDSLLVTTGRPSRGRRRVFVRLIFLVSGLFLLGLAFDSLVGALSVPVDSPAPHLTPTLLTGLFALYYIGMMLWAWLNYARAFRRTRTETSRRRMLYLMAGATAPALGAFPYLIFVARIAVQHSVWFWIAVIVSNLLITVLLVLMAYAVAFFGVPWPDRLVRSRLFEWILRGPVVASTALAITTLTRRAGEFFGVPYSAAVPILMVATILVLQYALTLLTPWWQRWFAQAGDFADLKALQDLENRLLTNSDLRQFLETILAAICDRLQTPAAFVVAFEASEITMTVAVGTPNAAIGDLMNADLLSQIAQKQPQSQLERLFDWGAWWLLPLRADEKMLLGLLGVQRNSANLLEDENLELLISLAERAADALRDRQTQREVLNVLQQLSPQMARLQQIRAAARFDGDGIRTQSALQMMENEDENLSRWTKDALTHYWGGPKLTENPLLKLQVVQRAIQEGESPANALRAILRQAIERVRPQGERRFTAEWILYNILEMKFMQGQKVRDIALRLAMSEADFYRKQRVAIEQVAKMISAIELEAQTDHPPQHNPAISIPPHKESD